MIYKIAIKDKTFDVEIGDAAGGRACVTVNGIPYEVVVENYDEIGACLASAPSAAPSADSPNSRTQAVASTVQTRSPAGIENKPVPVGCGRRRHRRPDSGTHRGGECRRRGLGRKRPDCRRHGSHEDGKQRPGDQRRDRQASQYPEGLRGRHRRSDDGHRRVLK